MSRSLCRIFRCRSLLQRGLCPPSFSLYSPTIFSQPSRKSFSPLSTSSLLWTHNNLHQRHFSDDSSAQPQDSITQLLQRATQMAQTGRAVEGIQLLETEVFQKSNYNVRIIDLLSQIYLGKNEFEKCKQVCLFNRSSADITSRLGEACERLGDISSAVKYYQEALNIEPSHANTCLRWGYIALSGSQQRPEEADDYLGLAEKLFTLPQNATAPMKEELLFGVVQVHFKKKKYQRVISLIKDYQDSLPEPPETSPTVPEVQPEAQPEASVAQDPRSSTPTQTPAASETLFAPLLHLLAESYRHVENYESAISSYEEFVHAYPTYVRNRNGDPVAADQVMADAWLKRGICLFSSQRFEEAESQFDELIRVGKYSLAEAYCYKSLCAEKKGDWDGVIKNATKSIELNPNLLETFRARANAYDMVALHELAQHDRRRYQYLERNFLYYGKPKT